MQTDKESLMNCDIETGICEVADPTENAENVPHSEIKASEKPVRLLFFTDPICSSCWGIEPQVRKLKQEYGDYFSIDYRMGGLLKSWDEYGGSDVNGPESVAQHWDEAGEYYEMPINGDIWKQDPLDSSYPPSIAFKAAQLQDSYKSEQFLRRIKEMVLVEKKNITKWEHLAAAAEDAGLEPVQFKDDFENKAEALFKEDLLLKSQLGVRGFPTIFFIDEDDNRFKVYGSKPYEEYEKALLKLVSNARKSEVSTLHEAILQQYRSITTKELAVLSNKNMAESESILQAFAQQGKVEEVVANTGSLWKVIA
jgi:putative protein-disulfide isomerase